jgi:hypothetical protein
MPPRRAEWIPGLADARVGRRSIAALSARQRHFFLDIAFSSWAISSLQALAWADVIASPSAIETTSAMIDGLMSVLQVSRCTV